MASFIHFMSLLALSMIFTTTIDAAGRGNHVFPPTNTTDQYLTIHNQARAAVGVSPLRWSPKLASNASLLARNQRNKNNCGFIDLSSSIYGANQALANFRPSPAEVVRSWVAEKAYYNYANNSCAAGHQCGTYTQVVWRKSEELGCSQVVCTNGVSLTICIYYPHGNVQGQSPY